MAKNKWRGFRSQRDQVVQQPRQQQSATMPPQQPINPGAQAQIQVAGRFYTGPIPEPQALAEYEHINPGLANRIVAMAEREPAHRHRITNRRSWGEIVITLLGQIFGFLIGVMTIGIGGFLLYQDKKVGGLVALTSGVVMLVGAFIYQRTRAAPQTPQTPQTPD